MIWECEDHTLHLFLASKRVDGNKKGLLTRARQPKAAARALRQRYLAIGQGRELCYEGWSEDYHCRRVYN